MRTHGARLGRIGLELGSERLGGEQIVATVEELEQLAGDHEQGEAEAGQPCEAVNFVVKLELDRYDRQGEKDGDVGRD
jgi:hypothetical protein